MAIAIVVAISSSSSSNSNKALPMSFVEELLEHIYLDLHCYTVPLYTTDPSAKRRTNKRGSTGCRRKYNAAALHFR